LKSNLLSAQGVLSRTVCRYFSLQSFCTTVVFVIFVIFAVIIVVFNSSALRTGLFIEYGMYVPTYL